MSQHEQEILKRTHTCGQLRGSDVGSRVRLCGWVRSYRDHGGVVFIDLRDRDGVTQIVFNPSSGSAGDDERYAAARALRDEWVVSVAGTVRPRGEGRTNPKLPTGEIEIIADDLVVLNKSDTVPFEPDEYAQVSEDTRLRYRYIDIRRPEMTRALRMRHAISRTIRSILDESGFVEVETPFLTKSTPEGVRDFLVPSRLQQGSFYALPQSPQLFKQLLMVAGMDKYYQIVRCFRDEDLRADRQPEFTQLDLEMSFCTEADIMAVTDRIMKAICEVCGKKYPFDIPVIKYDEAVELYGIDRPDLRFGMKLHTVTDIAAGTSFKVFTDVIAQGGVVKAVCPPGGAKFTRKEIDAYTAHAAQLGAKGLAWCKLENGGFAGGAAKFIPADAQARLRELFGAREGDIFFFVADKASAVNRILSSLRCKLAEDLKLYSPDDFAWCWVVDFPLVEWNAEEKRWDSLHHPFTSPKQEDMAKLESSPGSVKARAYDIVCNGMELGGGSIRIHSTEVQQKVFGLLGIGPESARAKFGFLLDALRFGAPPHGGIALGLDRVAMIMTGGQSIRDVIAFPKTQRGMCPLTEAPSVVEDKQLAELDLKVIAPPKPTAGGQ